MARPPRPTKVLLPPAKPGNQKDQIDALWATVESLQAQVDRLEGDDDHRATRAAEIRSQRS